jgi:hypothetical protein
MSFKPHQIPVTDGLNDGLRLCPPQGHNGISECRTADPAPSPAAPQAPSLAGGRSSRSHPGP